MTIFRFVILKVTALFFNIIIILCLCFSPSFAQKNKAYRIGPQDILSLSVYAGGEVQHQVKLHVSTDGFVKVPLLGSIKAVSLTVSQLEDKITVPLAAEYLVNPQVTIVVEGYHSLKYFISGALNSPGLYEMTSQATLMELIAKAGGTTPERSNVAYILRSSADEVSKGKDIKHLLSKKDPIKVDLTLLLDKGDMTKNITLQTGDVIYIPLQDTIDVAVNNVYLEGEVEKWGVYKYTPGLTALNLCIMAGGFTDFAAPNRTKIFRKRKETGEIIIIKIDLDDVRTGKTPDIELKPGDRISVPESWI
ncbi:polysaccharide biosynthesis/export family protein [Desulfococcaceae bacterium HSG7]|nr:polysaccharide biosynthesis/export family protein [Desulfococcaceae bacterium HSG7]